MSNYLQYLYNRSQKIVKKCFCEKNHDGSAMFLKGFCHNLINCHFDFLLFSSTVILIKCRFDQVLFQSAVI